MLRASCLILSGTRRLPRKFSLIVRRLRNPVKSFASSTETSGFVFSRDSSTQSRWASASYVGAFAADVILTTVKSRDAALDAPNHLAGLFLFGTVGGVLAAAAAESIGGATAGKWICGLRTLREDLSPCSFLAGIGRNAAFYIDGFFFGVIAATAMRRSRRRQRLGDQWAHTVVAVAKTLPDRALKQPVLMGVVLSMACRGVVQFVALVVLELAGN